VRAVTKYVATDGSEWATRGEAEARDWLDARVQAIEARLPARPNVHGARKPVNVELVAQCKTEVVALCREMYPDEGVFSYPAHSIHPMSYAGRFLSETGGPLNRVWYWFCCYADGYVFDQPYFALNPGTHTSEAPADPGPELPDARQVKLARHA
jgi:hypothetical protein